MSRSDDERTARAAATASGELVATCSDFRRPRSPTPRGFGFLCLFVAACSSEIADTPPARSDASPEAAAASGCDLDFAHLEGQPPVSFKDDVMPIFGASCNHGSCHHGSSQQGQLLLGPRCDYDRTTRECHFNEEGQPPLEGLSGNEARGIPPEPPLTHEILRDVHATLVGTPSDLAPAARRIAPGNPGESFLIHKVAGTQDESPFDCSGARGCGQSMPLNNETLCAASPDRFETLVTWVLQGAPNN